MTKAKLLRRAFGSVCLLLAVGMVVFGQATPPPGGDHTRYLAYWALCILFVALAMMIAIVDLVLVRRAARQEQRALFQDTLLEIEARKARQPREAKRDEEP